MLAREVVLCKGTCWMCVELYLAGGGAAGSGPVVEIPRTLEEAERLHIEEYFARHGVGAGRALTVRRRLLGLNPSTLRGRMKRSLGIRRRLEMSAAYKVVEFRNQLPSARIAPAGLRQRGFWDVAEYPGTIHPDARISGRRLEVHLS